MVEWLNAGEGAKDESRVILVRELYGAVDKEDGWLISGLDDDEITVLLGQLRCQSRSKCTGVRSRPSFCARRCRKVCEKCVCHENLNLQPIYWYILVYIYKKNYAIAFTKSKQVHLLGCMLKKFE